MGSNVGGRDLEFGVATWKPHCGKERGHDMKLMSRHRLLSKRSRHGIEVATWSALVGQKRHRDINLMSRHGRQYGRSRHGFRRRDLEFPLWPK